MYTNGYWPSYPNNHAYSLNGSCYGFWLDGDDDESSHIIKHTKRKTVVAAMWTDKIKAHVFVFLRA